ncbi:MAG: hypothetical protein CMA00_004005 [Methanobacteriota archaeon]|nr:MAG: hypothetical protein CMA00_004005 [Euryarchaeota archaeon]
MLRSRRSLVSMNAQSLWPMHREEVAVFDRNAISLGIDEFDLMSSAAEALAEEAKRMCGEGRVLFLCGPGNNGGDGFLASISEHLSGRADVIASHADSKTEVSSRARVTAGSLIEIDVWPSVPHGDWSLVVDCLLGAGGTGPESPLRSPIREIVHWARSIDLPVLSCDIPTGLGREECLVADRTITFHSKKMGMDPTDCGEIVVCPLPWPEEVQDCGIGDSERYPPIRVDAKKGDRGRLLVIGGGPYHGAPILSGLAAARSGCDLVHVAMPSDASKRVDWPASLIPHNLPDEQSLSLESLSSVASLLDSNRSPNAIVIGPGLGREEITIEASTRVISMAKERHIPVVVDADAISSLPQGLWPEGVTGVATPHSIEAERWLSEATPEEALSGVKGEDSCIVITGPVDLIIGAEGRSTRASGGHPRMAVGGTGDLLAGSIGGLIAQGMPPWPAARLGCALLREAGNRAASEKGPGLLAEDVPIHIAHTLSDWTGVHDAGQ